MFSLAQRATTPIGPGSHRRYTSIRDGTLPLGSGDR